MKKIFFSLIILGSTIAMFYSCKKDTNKTPSDTTIETQHTDFEWEVYHKLKAYKHKKNSASRGLYPISLDSAEWYLDTQFNVEEARTEYPYKLEALDSTYFTLELNGSGMAEISAMSTMYNSMLDFLYNIVATSEYIPIFGHIERLSSDNNEAQYVFRLGLGNYYNGNYAPEYYDWKFGNMLGRCDGTHQWESDAGQELKTRLNNPFFAYVTPGSFVGSDNEKIIRYYNENGSANPTLYYDTYDEHPQSSQVNYFYYYETNASSSYDPCLESEEIEFYLDKAHKIIYTSENDYIPGSTIHRGQRPEGLTYEWFTIDTPNGYDNSSNLYYWTHRYYIHYRQRVNIPIPD